MVCESNCITKYQKTMKLLSERNCQTEALRQSFASNAKNKPTVPRKELTPTAVRSIRIEAQA